MKDYVLSAGAELDLDEIWEYIAQDKIRAADRWIEKLFNAFGILAQNPAMGHKRHDLTSNPFLAGRCVSDSLSRSKGVH
jgi:plasmid stabilization system protein ParE